MSKLYTLQIHHTNKEVFEFKNLEKAYVESFTGGVYSKGFKVRRSPTTQELISPLHIATIYIIEQPGKI